jgi:hypothetical protein
MGPGGSVLSELRISASLYTTWKRCPAQAIGRIDGHYPPDSIHTFRGLLAHRIVASHITNGHIAPSGFRQKCYKEIGSSQLNWKINTLGLKPHEIRNTIIEVEDLYARWRQLVHTLDYGPLTAETHLEHQIDTDVTLIGTIDAVATNHRLIDWKFGELGDAADQLRFYAALYSLATGIRPIAVEAVSVRTGERHEEWITRRIITDTLVDITRLTADLQTRATPTTPGPYCQWCPLLTDCPAGQQAMALIG